MYANLKAEMARRGITSTQLSKVIGVTIQTFSKKINGQSDFTLSEAYQIKEFLLIDMPIEELFKETNI